MDHASNTIGRGRSVLIVEDEPILRMVVGDFFADAGFEVMEAASFEEAIAILAASPNVFLVFTDIQMPGAVDGVGLATLISKRWPEVRTIVTSGARQPSSRPLPPRTIFMAKPYRLPAITKFLEVA